jgi:hypothetical protein
MSWHVTRPSSSREVDCETIVKVSSLYHMDFRLFQYSLTDYLDFIDIDCSKLIPESMV